MNRTPGPYVARFNLLGQAVVDGIYGIQVAHFGDSAKYSGYGFHSISKEEAMANAILFAAAPKLLEAAKKALAYFDWESPEWENVTLEDAIDAGEKLKSAIREAEGEESKK